MARYGERTNDAARALTAAFSSHMREMQPRYTGPHANIRYGNDLAARRVEFIKGSAPAVSHRRLLCIEARRLEKEARSVGKTRLNSPLGSHVDADYAEQLKQAAFAVRLVAMSTD